MAVRQPPRSRSLFVPKTERIEEDEALILRVHLAGFSAKDIDCRIIAPSHYIRVCSDPALKNWHFNTLFESIPEKFNLIEAKTEFDDGIFTIKVPKVVSAEMSAGARASEATARQEAPSLQESDASMNGRVSQKGQDQIPSKANFPLSFTRKMEIDYQSTVGQVGDQNAIEKDKEKSAESVDQEKEGEGKDTERRAESVDHEKEGEAKDMENATSSSSKSANDHVTTVVTERRYVVEKYTIISLIIAIGAYVFYNIHGQSRKK
nr:uncharacterized protein LOC118060140 isoform X2 [Populus alba]